MLWRENVCKKTKEKRRNRTGGGLREIEVLRLLGDRRGRGSEEGLAHRGEGVDEHTVLQTFAAMHDVGFLHEHVASTDNLGDAIDGELEDTALHEGDLAMRVAVHVAHRTCLELDFDHHEVVVVGHDLAIYFSGVGGALPLYVVVEDEGVTLDGDGQSMDFFHRLCCIA